MISIVAFILCVIRNLPGSQIATWSEQIAPPGTQSLSSVSAVSLNVCWASGINGTVFYTSNGGVNWLSRGSVLFMNNTVNVICGIDSLTAVCAFTISQSSSTIIFRTTNAGISWQPVYAQANGNIRDIKLFAAGSAFAYGDPVGGVWTFLKTTNSGASFLPAGFPLNSQGNETGNYKAMAVGLNGLAGLDVWFGTSSGRIYLTATGGSIWITSLAQFQNIYTIAFAADGILGFSGGNPNTISKSINGGVAWVIQLGLPGVGDCNAMAGVGLLDFWYSRGDQIFHSQDGGLTFVFEYTSPVAGTYEEISFAGSLLSDNIESTLRGWAVTNNGAISVYDGPPLAGTKQIDREAISYSLSQNYPNPFNPVTSIRYQIPKGGYVNLQISDELGRTVETIVDGYQNRGKYEVNWNADKFSSGTYFVTLQSGSFLQTRKMLLLK